MSLLGCEIVIKEVNNLYQLKYYENIRSSETLFPCRVECKAYHMDRVICGSYAGFCFDLLGSS